MIEYIVESKLQNYDSQRRIDRKRFTQLQSEILEIQKNFELKKEEFLKVQGALEMLQILDNEKTSKET